MAIVVVGPFLTSASEISAEPRLIPVAHFLATGLYGNKCATALSKLFRNPYGPLSVLTLACVQICYTSASQQSLVVIQASRFA